MSGRQMVKRPNKKSLSERLGKTPGVKKELQRATRPLLLQKRRAELEGCRLRTENLVAKFTDGKLTSEKRMELYLQAQAISSLGILKGIGLMADMLSWESRRLIKGKYHLKRNSYLDVIWTRLDGIEDALSIQFSEDDQKRIEKNLPEGEDVPSSAGVIQATISMDQKLAALFDMVHELCLEKDPRMFEVADKNGIVITEDRYAEPPPGMMEGRDVEPGDEFEDDEDAMPEEELERMQKEAEKEDE